MKQEAFHFQSWSSYKRWQWPQ